MSPLDPNGERRLHAFVQGRVQGVGYRATTLDEAKRLGLAGWVRNRLDGSVEVLAEGSEAKLNRLLAHLHEGPWGADVSSVDETWSEAQGAPRPFHIRHTE